MYFLLIPLKVRVISYLNLSIKRIVKTDIAAPCSHRSEIQIIVLQVCVIETKVEKTHTPWCDEDILSLFILPIYKYTFTKFSATNACFCI